MVGELPTFRSVLFCLLALASVRALGCSGEGGGLPADEYPKISGLNFDNHRTNIFGFGSESANARLGNRAGMRGVYEIEGSGFAETKVSPTEMIREYRERLAQPGWDIQNEGSGNGIAWFS